jgi:hypothetical protein
MYRLYVDTRQSSYLAFNRTPARCTETLECATRASICAFILFRPLCSTLDKCTMPGLERERDCTLLLRRPRLRIRSAEVVQSYAVSVYKPRSCNGFSSEIMSLEDFQRTSEALAVQDSPFRTPPTGLNFWPSFQLSPSAGGAFCTLSDRIFPPAS